MIGSRSRTPDTSSIRWTAREPLITRNRSAPSHAAFIRSSRWSPVESMKLNSGQVHDDHLGIVIPQDGVECAFEDRRRREIELPDRRQAVNPALAPLAYRKRLRRVNDHLPEEKCSRSGRPHLVGSDVLWAPDPIPPQ